MYIWWLLKFLVVFGCRKLTKPCWYALTFQVVSQQNLASSTGNLANGTGNRPPPRTHKLLGTHGMQQPSSSLLSVPNCCVMVFNAQWIGNKSATIYDRILTDKPSAQSSKPGATQPTAPASSPALCRAMVVSSGPVLNQRRKLPSCGQTTVVFVCFTW